MRLNSNCSDLQIHNHQDEIHLSPHLHSYTNTSAAEWRSNRAALKADCVQRGGSQLHDAFHCSSDIQKCTFAKLIAVLLKLLWNFSDAEL